LSQEVLVHITGIAAGGAGVGRLPDGKAVFVQRTAPGEDVEIRVIEEKRRWARAEVIAIRTRSSERRDAPCPHHARCGGCTLEHLTYEAQLNAKARIVADALRRIGGIDVVIPEVVASPAEFRYRNRVSFTLVRLGSGRVVAGFHELNHPERIVDIGDACMLPELPIAEVWGRLRAGWGEDANLLPWGRRLRLMLRAALSGEVGLVVDGGYTAGDPDALLERVHGLSAIWHRARQDDAHQLIGGAGAVEEDWQDEELALSGAMFLQVNRGAASLLEDYVVSIAGDVAGKRVVDAYCGIGLHARRLARTGARVIGIELDRDAVEEARKSVAEGLEIREGRVEDLLGSTLPADFVIVNPPRGGLDPAVPKLLATSRARILYVSCNPATLARDLQRLGSGYRLASLRCFDLFPQTAHVECVAELACVTS
jgi:23S rRNA (uracil1939-C5)-methyltransferase